jgi:hypothetical protein
MAVLYSNKDPFSLCSLGYIVLLLLMLRKLLVASRHFTRRFILLFLLLPVFLNYGFENYVWFNCQFIFDLVMRHLEEVTVQCVWPNMTSAVFTADVKYARVLTSFPTVNMW